MDEDEEADVSTSTFEPDLEERDAEDAETAGQDFVPSPFSKIPDSDDDAEVGTASPIQSPFAIDTSPIEHVDDETDAATNAFGKDLEDENIDNSEPEVQDLAPSPFSMAADAEVDTDEDTVNTIQSPFDMDEGPVGEVGEVEEVESEESEECRGIRGSRGTEESKRRIRGSQRGGGHADG